MTQTRLSLEGLSKRYYIGELQTNRPDTLYENLKRAASRPVRRAVGLMKGHSYAAMELNKELWALKNISFDVEEGEIVGIIGRNGAGKSTLLKILSRITPPTGGSAVINGSLSSLLEVGTGFHGNLTGRENIYLNGSILGMTKAEIDRKLDQIVAFSGVEKFIDTPVRFYSSGMAVRLAFSIAAHLEPDILIIDEVLAVGDISFHRKSMARMKEISTSGRTVLFVSHQIGQISALCSRVILMDQGQIVEDGPANAVVSKYFEMNQQSDGATLLERTDRDGSGEARCAEIWFEDSAGKPVSTILSGSEVHILLKLVVLDATADLSDLSVGMSFSNEFGQVIAILNMHTHSQTIDLTGKAEMVVRCSISRSPFNAGLVRYGFGLQRLTAGFPMIDHIETAGTIQAQPGDFFGSGIPPGQASKLMFDHDWTEV